MTYGTPNPYHERLGQFHRSVWFAYSTKYFKTFYRFNDDHPVYAYENQKHRKEAHTLELYRRKFWDFSLD